VEVTKNARQFKGKKGKDRQFA